MWTAGTMVVSRSSSGVGGSLVVTPWSLSVSRRPLRVSCSPLVISRWSQAVSRWWLVAGLAIALALTAPREGRAQTSADSLPELTQPVNDFAHLIDAENAAAMDRMIRAL